jgi:glycerol transport system ATP-binding protein
MARIDIEALRHSYAADPTRATTSAGYALKGLSHTFADGGAYALLGPSGCGKTTLLNVLSGLIAPTEGRVRFDGEDVTLLDARRRNIAQVFQFPVVYDSMTVRENLEFPLRCRGVAAGERRRRADEMLALTGLGAIAGRPARNLTADEKQKISLGRGLIREDVAAILFDEPLTVIDPHLKWELRAQLKALHARTRRTMIYVTHDQSEALSFAEQVVVMNAGEVLQVGTPEDLFARPAHVFVGHFIGSPGMNVLPLEVEGGMGMVGGCRLDLPALPPSGARLELGVRPEHVRFGTEGWPVQVERVEDLGRVRIVHGRLGGLGVRASIEEDIALPAEPRMSFAPGGVHVYGDGWRVKPAGESP